MSEMVEKVAKAIRIAANEQVNREMSLLLAKTSSSEHVEEFLTNRLARAALEAMYGDPGHDITAAVCKPTRDRTWAVKAWNAMITEALK